MITVVHSNPVWLPQTQTWIYNQITHLPSDLIDCHVVCERTENLDQFPLANLHNFSAGGALERLWDRGWRRIGASRHLGFLPRTARRFGARVIHSHFGDVAWTNVGAARRAGCQHVVTFYGYDMSYLPQLPTWRERYEELFRTVDLVLCEGPHMAERIVALGCPRGKVRVQHLGIRLGDLPFRPRQWCPGEKLRVLIAATFTEKKGIPYALSALGRLQRDVDLEVTVIGDAREESEESLRQRDEILRVIKQEKLGAKVRLLGYRPHSTLIEEAYRHHVFISPSVTAKDGGTEGGLPVTIVEMLASGMLVVSTRHCDIPEVVQHRKTGLLAEERNVDDLSECLVMALREPDQWTEMAVNGRNLVEAEFSAELQGRRLARHYSTLVDGGLPVDEYNK